jgi:primary-amine oxidase
MTTLTRLAGAGLALVTLVSPLPAPAQQAMHGYALSELEIASAVDVITRAYKKPDLRFAQISLCETPKTGAANPTRCTRRAVEVVAYDLTLNRTFEGLVDLASSQLVEWRAIDNAQPRLLANDFVIARLALLSHDGWRSALARRGVTDLAMVTTLPADPGSRGTQKPVQNRVVAVTASLADAPIDGLLAYVDVTRGEVLEIVDSGSAAPPRPLNLSAYRDARQADRAVTPSPVAVHPILREGNEIDWGPWRFQFSMNSREGLVLHDVRVRDGATLRSVIKRASISESVVAYAASDRTWSPVNVMDAGVFGLGLSTISLRPGVAVPTDAVVVPAILHDDLGRARRVESAVAFHQRRYSGVVSFGDQPLREVASLVATHAVSIGNYQYTFNWLFSEDASIEVEVLAAGVLAVKAVPGDLMASGAKWGPLVAPGITAVHHQHFFCFRLDMDIDGADHNSVVELRPSVAGTSGSTRHGNHVRVAERRFATEGPSSSGPQRVSGWRIENVARRNALQQRPSYLLLPGEHTAPVALNDSDLLRRAGFVRATMWVSSYDATQLFATGRYPFQNGSKGLSDWVRARRPVGEADVVVWYTMGFTHIPRAEEWPVMSPYRLGFRLLPSGFFERNPMMNAAK